MATAFLARPYLTIDQKFFSYLKKRVCPLFFQGIWLAAVFCVGVWFWLWFQPTKEEKLGVIETLNNATNVFPNNRRLFVAAIAMLESAMRLVVGILMLLFARAKRRHMLLQIGLRKKDAGAMGTFEVAVVAGLLFCHGDSLVDVYVDFFAVEF